MELNAIRMRKEARQLMGPWAAITGAGALALVLGSPWRPEWALLEWIAAAVGEEWLVWISVAGVPLLAGMALGYEFQYRTLPVLLTEPVERKRIWREKMTATVGAGLFPAFLFVLNARQQQFDTTAWVAALGMIIVMSASATYWTLRARGTIGGLALNTGVNALLFVLGQYAVEKLGGSLPAPLVAAVIVLVGLYGAGMVWLGRRALLAFEAVDGGGAAESEFEALTSWLLPRRASDWLVCGPRGAVLNLVRRELRLLRPVWPLTLLAMLSWMILIGAGAIPTPAEHGRSAPADAAIIAMAFTAFISPLLAVLAGVLPLGEDKQQGTHEWHMTLPVSTQLQWTVRLVVALLVSGLCAVAAPAASAYGAAALRGVEAGMFDARTAGLWFLVAWLMTLLSFWLACALKGTVRAAMGVIPALMGAGMLIEFGSWVAERTTAAAGGAIDRLYFQADPFWMTRVSWWNVLMTEQMALAVILPVVAVVMLHSFRLYGGQAEGTVRQVARAAAPLALAVFLTSFVVGGVFGVLNRGQAQVAELFRETHAAIARQQASAPAAAGPLRLQRQELGEAMSETTRHWLGSSTISVVPQELNRPGSCCGYSTTVAAPDDRRAAAYSAVIPLSNGSVCSLSFYTAGSGYGLLRGTC